MSQRSPAADGHSPTVLFLAGFALKGFALNLVTHRFLGVWTPPMISIPAACFATLPIVRILSAGLARVIPQDQTFAVSFDSLMGRAATIVNGVARQGRLQPLRPRRRLEIVGGADARQAALTRVQLLT